MWKGDVGRVLSRVRSRSCSVTPSRMMATNPSSPLGEGRLEFATTKVPSLWSRLKQQKQGLGTMALSASVCFLAVGLIRQDKELTQAMDTIWGLKKQNESLREKLGGLKVVLEKGEDGARPEKDVMALLSEMLEMTGESDVQELPVGHDANRQGLSRAKFMV